MPLVYIILLNWNGWRDTIACLDSLGNLTYPDFKVIVVDNGSTDESVASIRNAHPAVTLLAAGGNLGFSGGNNVGIRYALESGAEFVWVLNNDTVVTNNALSAMVDMAISDAKIGAVGSVLYFMDAPTVVQAWGGGCVSLWSGISRHRSSPGQLNYITGASILLSMAALNQIGLLDDGFFMY
ncbi:MAG: glycosyltransferase family 2 protein, partial [Desulfobulbaceae bacterium]|nr:glycosyltransferase family 2 protein [Desulfobulbaceae bacterium]